MWQQIWGKALLWVSGFLGNVSPEGNLNDGLTQSWGLYGAVSTMLWELGQVRWAHLSCSFIR